MKKIIIILGLAAMSSCKKDYICTCTWTYPKATGPSSIEYKYHDTKAKAKKACDDQAANSANLYGGSCSLN